MSTRTTTTKRSYAASTSTASTPTSNSRGPVPSSHVLYPHHHHHPAAAAAAAAPPSSACATAAVAIASAAGEPSSSSSSSSSSFAVAPPSPPVRLSRSPMINSRRPPLPPLSKGAPAGFRIERFQVDGVEREMLTIEDTPEPQPGPPTTSSSRSNGAHHLVHHGNGLRSSAPSSASSNPTSIASHQYPSNGAFVGGSSGNAEPAVHYDPSSAAAGAAATAGGPSAATHRRDNAKLTGSTSKRRKNNDHGTYGSDALDYAARIPPALGAVSGSSSGRTAAAGGANRAAPVGMHPPQAVSGASAPSARHALPSSASKKRKADEIGDATCDKDGHFIIVPGNQIVDGKNKVTYTIDRSLGQGTFGKVVAAKSSDTNQMVAVKVIRAVPKYREAAKVEIAVLDALAYSDPDNNYQCIHMISSFDYRDHTCIVSDLLSVSVFDFLKDNGYAPFPFSHVQSFAKQLLRSVQYVHKEHYIHTDLKPENILLEERTAKCIDNPFNPKHKHRRILKNPRIRLIDFGSATKVDEYHASVVSTRHYRAPEIILGLDWSYPCDVWSIGCILVEFVTGEALFQTHENLEHLAMMEKVFGRIPSALADSAINKARRDVQDGRDKNKAAPDVLNWFVDQGGQSRRSWKVNFPTSATVRQSKKFVEGMRSLDRIVMDACAYAYDDVAVNKTPLQAFVDLLRQLLRWDPKDRLTVEQALKHDFFNVPIKDDVLRAWPEQRR